MNTEIIVKAPVRVSLCGGGTDLPDYYNNHGTCKILSMAIKPGIEIHGRIIKRETNHEIKNGIAWFWNGGEYRPNEFILKLVDYLLGGQSPIQYLYDKETIFAIDIIDPYKQGSGLGASSAIVVGFCKLFFPFIDGVELAKMASCFEINQMGENIGIQDHLASACGGLRYYRYGRNGDEEFAQITSFPHYGDMLKAWMYLFEIPKSRPKEGHTSHTGMISDEKRLESLKNMESLTADMAYSLSVGDWVGVGSLLNKAWEQKKISHGQVSESLNELYEIMRLNGMVGGKVTGSMSGGAGHFLVYCPPSVAIDLIDQMESNGYKYVPVEYSEEGVTYECRESW